MVNRAGVVLQGDGDRAHRRELLDVGAEADAVRARELTHPVEVLEPERDRLDEDVERARVLDRLGQHLLHLVHPGCGRVAVGHGVREQRRPRRDLRDDLVELGRELERAQLAGGREPVAGLAFERGRAGAEHLAGEPLRLREHGFVSGLAQGSRGGSDAAAGARDLLVRHARDLLLVLLGAPARERQMGVAVDEAREQRAAAGVDVDVRVRVGLERGDAAVLNGHAPGLEGHLAGAIGPQVPQAGLRGQEHLSGVVERDHSGAGSSIGIRSPCSRAADTARS